MIDKAQFITDFGLGEYPVEEQDALFEDFSYEFGAALSDGLTEEQLTEFSRIIDGDDSFTHDWLQTNRPGYETDPNFEQLADSLVDDPDSIPAEKVYATSAWVALNRPDYTDVLERVKREYRHTLDSAK